MLVEVIDEEPDDGDVDALCALGSETGGQDTRRARHRLGLVDTEVSKVVNVPARNHHAVTQVGPGIFVDRGQVKRAGVLVLPQEPAWYLDLARNFAADQALVHAEP